MTLDAHKKHSSTQKVDETDDYSDDEAEFEWDGDKVPPLSKNVVFGATHCGATSTAARESSCRYSFLF